VFLFFWCQQPVKEEKEVQLASRRLPLPSPGLCGREGLVSCSITLQRTAFVPGEYLFAEAHIQNLTSGFKVRKVRCVFNQVGVLHVMQPVFFTP
jgi:hypothetical protein